MSRVAVVTGGSRGLGYACAERLASAGAHVAVLDIAEKAAASAAVSLPGGPHLGMKADVTRAEQVVEAIERVHGTLGPTSILVNNAGILRGTRFLDISESEWDAVLDVSVKGAFLCSKACAPSMVDAGWGRIVNISSTAGRSVSTLGGAHYTTAKAALLGMTRALAKEFADCGITVNAVCPGLFATEMTLSTVDSKTLDRHARGFPIGRLGRPEEVGALVAFLCSDDAAYITGASVDINGGDLML